MPAEYKAMIEAATREGATAMMTRYDAKNPAAWKRLLQKDITVRRFPEDILAAARVAAEELLETEAAADARYAKILGQWRKFRDDSFDWFGAAELSYMDFAMGDNALGK
ncbi:MAG: TRAP-type mannitol/chloroaromatic compound transport system substrate-binding protein [Bacteroidia bacterium]